MAGKTALVYCRQQEVIDALVPCLTSLGFVVAVAMDEQAGLEVAARLQPDLAIVFSDCCSKHKPSIYRRLVPNPSMFLMVIANNRTGQELISAAEAQADHYVAGPVGMAELIARVRATVRRAEASWAESPSGSVYSGERIVAGPIELEPETRQVFLGNRSVTLTKTEFRILRALAENRGRTLSPEELLTRVWGPERIDQPEYLRLYIQRLRRKLHDAPRQPRFIVTVRGVGYHLRDEGQEL